MEMIDPLETDSAPGGALPLSENRHLLRWVEKMARLTKPAAIHWVDGSAACRESKREVRTLEKVAPAEQLKTNLCGAEPAGQATADMGAVA